MSWRARIACGAVAYAAKGLVWWHYDFAAMMIFAVLLATLIYVLDRVVACLKEIDMMILDAESRL